MHRLGIIAVSAMLILACGQSKDTGTDQNDAGSQKPAAKKAFLSIGSAPPGGAFFQVGSALAEVANGEEGWQVTSEATKGTQENIRRLESKELDFGLANAAITYFAARGEGFEKAYDVKSVMSLAPNVALFVKGSDDIQTIADLKGKRVVLGPAGAGFEYFLQPIFEAHGISMDDMSVLYNTQLGAVSNLSDGAADAAFLGGAIPTGSVTQALAGGLELLTYSEGPRKALIEKYPFFRSATIPAGAYPSIDQPVEALEVGAMQLITRADLDEDTVYRFTKRIYENAAAVVERHPAGKAIKAPYVCRNLGLDFHPGAIKFYKEIGAWPEEEGQ